MRFYRQEDNFPQKILTIWLLGRWRSKIRSISVKILIRSVSVRIKSVLVRIDLSTSWTGFGQFVKSSHNCLICLKSQKLCGQEIGLLNIYSICTNIKTPTLQSMKWFSERVPKWVDYLWISDQKWSELRLKIYAPWLTLCQNCPKFLQSDICFSKWTNVLMDPKWISAS